MDAYTGFAEVYDLFMDQVPYEKWSRRITEILNCLLYTSDAADEL